MRHEIVVGAGEASRTIAVETRAGRGSACLWLGGFRSDMSGTKAEALDAWATQEGRPFVRFDYSGHGSSGGRFEDGTISRWLEESLAVIDEFVEGRPVLVGSSMGGWLALLATRALRERGSAHAPAGLVLLAPAADFTERLMWDAFSDDVRTELMRDGVHHRPSAYSDDPYPITRALIEDGRRHLILHGGIETGCPVHVIQGMLDRDVPHTHALTLMERLPGETTRLTLVKDGDHRLSTPEDLDRLVQAASSAVDTADEWAADAWAADQGAGDGARLSSS